MYYIGYLSYWTIKNYIIVNLCITLVGYGTSLYIWSMVDVSVSMYIITDYGFLHYNLKSTISLVYIVLLFDNDGLYEYNVIISSIYNMLSLYIDYMLRSSL